MPSERDVRDRLEEWGLTPAQIERIVFQYTQAEQTQGAANWSPTAFDEWLDREARALTGSRQTPGAAFIGASQQVLENAKSNDRSFAAVKQMAKDQAALRRQEQQNRFYAGARIDHGPVMDPDMLANTIATGAWTDVNGNYIDPESGQRTDEPVPADANSIWHSIKGQRFNMGSLAAPGYTHEQLQGLEYGRHVSTRRGGVAHPSADTMARDPRRVSDRTIVPQGVYPNKPRQFVTPSQALSLLSSMDEDYLIQLQQQMYSAGLYPEDSRPRWGTADVATREAFRALFIESSLTPEKNVAAVLADMQLERLNGQPLPEGSPGSGGRQLPNLVLPDFEPTVANEEELRQSIDDIASETIGQYLPDDQREALIAKLRDREVGLQRQQYDRDVTRVREQYDAEVSQMGGAAGEGGIANSDVEAFLQALGMQESGGVYNGPASSAGAQGKYQIMPANWPEWSRRAGLGPNAPKTPQNQELVARQIVMDYFNQFKNWRDVAVAWYSGPGNVPGKRFSDRRQSGGPSINDYADEVMGRMAQVRRGTVDASGQMRGFTVGGRIEAPIEAFDPIAEAEAAIKAADPAGWEASEWGGRAAEFFGALGGVLGGS